jgi:hypothetical protein
MFAPPVSHPEDFCDDSSTLSDNPVLVLLLLLDEGSTTLPCFGTLDAPPLGTIDVMAIADADLLTSFLTKGDRGREWAATQKRSSDKDARRILATAVIAPVERDNQRILINNKNYGEIYV